jgi:hypothetical protein
LPRSDSNPCAEPFLNIESHCFCIDPTEPGNISFVTSFRHQLHTKADAEDRSSFLKDDFVEDVDQSRGMQIRHSISEMSDTRKDDLVRRSNIFN